MKLITIHKVSEILNVKEATLYSWVRNGTIPSYKLNGAVRFDVDEIKEWVIGSKRKTPNVPTLGTNALNLQEIDSIIKKAIEGVKPKEYTSANGKPGQDQVSGRRF